MENAYQYENELMDEAFAELKSRHVFSAELRDKLLKIFGDRFTNGLKLANSRRVRRYEFKPSRRVVWVVKGRTNEYQIIPDLPFCYCDDYYFRDGPEERLMLSYCSAAHCRSIGSISDRAQERPPIFNDHRSLAGKRSVQRLSSV